MLRWFYQRKCVSPRRFTDQTFPDKTFSYQAQQKRLRVHCAVACVAGQPGRTETKAPFDKKIYIIYILFKIMC